jgi:hypothetical protein
VLEYVVRHEDDGRFGEGPGGDVLAADAFLELAEGERMTRLVREDLAVEDGASGKTGGGLDDLGESLGEQFLAARPDGGGLFRGG